MNNFLLVLLLCGWPTAFALFVVFFFGGFF